MGWGFWTMAVPVDLSDGKYYHVDNRGYYLSGENTSDSAMGGLQNLESWWLYSGGAEGTYWTDTGGKDMTGTFEAKVTFMDKLISNFNLSVAGEGHSVSVRGASGFLGGTSHFGLSTGAALIDETGGVFRVRGSFYGPAAQAMGGVWNIDSGSKYAAGIFHGDKPDEPTSPPYEPPPPPPPPPPPVPPPEGPTERWGYFTAMLTKDDGDGGYTDNGVFVSNNFQDLNGTGNADDIVYSHHVVVNGLTGDAGELISVDYGDGYGILEDDGPYLFSSRTEIGHNAYMEWGYWKRNDPMTDTDENDNWIINNSGYYIAGDNTTPSIPITGIFDYSGGAEGTYWIRDASSNQSSGVDMTGNFSAHVDFTSTGGGQISNFDLDVKNPGDENYYVTIEDAGGSFAGASSHFTLSGGTWSIRGGEPETTAAYGSVYGPNAEAMGGVWGVAKQSGDFHEYATGIFHGTRP